MKDKLRALFERHKTFCLFAVFGIPPTLIGFGVYLLCAYPLELPAFVANAVAWLVGVLSSFFLYRKYVFHSTETTPQGIFQEFIKFVSMRVTSGLMETGLVYLFVDVLNLHKLFFKVFASLCAALLNYVISMVFVFRRRRQEIRKVHEEN